MVEFIAADRGRTGPAGGGLSYALAAKLCEVPLYLARSHGQRLEAALQSRAFDAPTGANLAHILGSKFIGTIDARSRYRVTDEGVALVPVQGVLIDRGAWLGDLYGIATSYEGLAEQFKRLGDDAGIKSVVLDIDSPGGMVAGLFDLTAEMDKLKAKKPVYALAANMAASAAYALACVADEVYVTRTGEAGSIGVIQIHQSYGRAFDQMGIDTTIVCEPAPKANGNPYTELSHGARAEMSAGVADAYALFVRHVAKYRGMSEDAVRATQAAMYSGDKAVAADLADGVMSIEELLGHISKASAKRVRRPRAATRGTTANRGDGRMARPAVSAASDDDFEAVMTNAVKALADGHQALAAAVKVQAAVPAAPAAVQPPAVRAVAAQASDISAEERIAAILDCPEAGERPVLAKHLALKTKLDPKDAAATLAAAPVEKPAAQAAGFYAAVAKTGGNPRVAAAESESGAVTGADRAKANIERQKQRFAKKG